LGRQKLWRDYRFQLTDIRKIEGLKVCRKVYKHESNQSYC